MDEAYRVLVVDDDPDVALYTRTVLERRAGCVVKAVGTARAALTAVEEFRPDVVVTDIEMPGMSGLELLSSIRQIRPAIPVVVMTAHVSVDYAVGALQSQANEFLTKPVNSTELVGIVQRLAAEGRARHAATAPRDYVLAVGGHPDDVELGIGGTLAAHRAAGDEVVILSLSRGDEDQDRHAEALRAAEILGARLFLEQLGDDEILGRNAAVAAIASVVAEVRPTIVYTHSIHDRKPVHRAVHEAVIAATRGVQTVACFQSPTSTVDFRPTRFLPIDEHLDRKLELLACYPSGDSRGHLSTDLVLAAARYWSRFGAGGSMVEPLEIIRESADMSAPVRRRVGSERRAAPGSV